MANVAEHRVQMPADPPAGKAAAAPEMGLNRFVRFVVLIERFGNALGTLAFTWGTVVLLGGYSSDLDSDFLVSTVIIFLEALRYARNYYMSQNKLFHYFPFGELHCSSK